MYRIISFYIPRIYRNYIYVDLFIYIVHSFRV
jgi:hypothetical protein